MALSTSIFGIFLSRFKIAHLSQRFIHIGNVNLTVKKAPSVLASPQGSPAAKGKVAVAPSAKKRHHLDVEMDPVKLCTRLVGGNIYKEGQDPELLPDSEYPDWLWKLRTVKEPPKLSELEYDSAEYWDHLKQEDKLRRLRMKAVKYAYKEF